MKRTLWLRMRRLVLSLLLCSFAAGGTFAQSSADASASTPPPKTSPADEYSAKLRKLTNSPTEYVGTLAEFINRFPYAERASSYFYSVRTVLKNARDAEETRKLANQLIADTESIPPSLKVDVYRYVGEAFFTAGFYDDSAGVARKVIALADESAYLDFKKKQSEFTVAELSAKNSNYKSRPLDEDRIKESFLGAKVSAHNLLAKSLWQQSKFDLAEQAYRESFALKVSKESALGLAKATEKNGKDDEALKYATVAALTGKLDPTEMDYFYSTYAKLHRGKTEGVEEYLNAEFEKTYKNPVKSEKYIKTAKRSDRIVLAEFFTGAGCVPCIPYDYTFEKALQDYSSKELGLLVYHWHAPYMDPLGNHSSDSRVKYYGLSGAPVLFIDGQKFTNDLDYNGGSGEASKIQKTADGVNANLKSDLEIPADASIDLKAKRAGEKVSVTVTADKVKNVSEDVTLHIALVENETVYSGENGLRVHFMVVRALAGDNDTRIFGFKIDPTKSNKFDYVFDVYRIVAQNFAYYDTKTSEMLKEFLGRMGGKMPDGLNIDFGFKYKKNQIDAENLSVVAFLQDNKTKKVLQSSIVNLPSK